MDRTLDDYFAAWNETNADDRRQLLGRCLSDDVELIDPTGRWQGIDGLSERIANYHSSEPGTMVVSASGVDEHNGIERDGERLLAPAGSHVLVAKGRAHTFWNAGNEVAVCLIVLAPPGFEAYFRELSDGLAQARSDDEAIELRHRLSASYDIEVVGPPIQTP